MNYFELDYAFRTPEGVSIPCLNGETVKGYETFFDTDKCTFYTFYDKEYEFDYLTPEEGSEIQDEPRVIADYHMWIGRQPRGGGFRPISKKFKEILEEHKQSDHRFYKAKVLFQGKFYPYFVWRILDEKYEEYIDFDKTLYNNLDLFRDQVHDELVVKKFKSHKEMEDYSDTNWDYTWNYERLVLKPNFRTLDYLYIYRLGGIVSERLKQAIESAALTGIRFNPLPIPIEFSDEV